jgi:pathogenesis-related protein 1
MIFIAIFIASFLAIFLQVCAAPVQSQPQRRGSSLTDFEISEYLLAHNQVRALYSAQALTWSDDLAAGASYWASQCKFEHSDGILSDLPYGENIAAATGNFGPASAVQSFLADEDSYNPDSPTFSDFTQVVWQNTTSVACAYNTQCSNIFPASSGAATLHVCLYNPPGNVIGLASENVVVPSWAA